MKIVSIKNIRRLLRISAFIMILSTLPFFLNATFFITPRKLLLSIYQFTLPSALLLLGLFHKKTRSGKVAIALALLFLCTAIMWHTVTYLYRKGIKEEVIKSLKGELTPEEREQYVETGAKLLLIATTIFPLVIGSYGIPLFPIWYILRKYKHLSGKMFTISFALAIVLYPLFFFQLERLLDVIAQIRLGKPVPIMKWYGEIYLLLLLAIPSFIVSILQFISLRQLKDEGR